MGVITGENAAINGQVCLRKFRVIDSTTPASGVCSASDGAPFKEPGNTDWMGVANAFGATPPRLPGSLFQFTCTNGTTGYDSGANGAYMERVKIYWDVEGAGFIYHEDFFSGTKALTKGTYTVALDSTVAPLSAMGRSCTINAVEYNIRRAVLTVECPGVPYNDTSTEGATGRAAGNFAAGAELDLYFDSYATLPSKDDLVTFTIEATSSTNWSLYYMLITDVQTDVAKADEQGRAVLNTCKLKMEWSGWKDGVKGHITTPGGTTLWPS